MVTNDEDFDEDFDFFNKDDEINLDNLEEDKS